MLVGRQHIALVLLLLAPPLAARAQHVPLDPSSKEIALNPAVERLTGEDADSHILFVRLLLRGKLTSPADLAPPDPLPTLTAQCSRRPSGKLLFELFADFGNITDRAFYPPWKPADSGELFPPATQKVTVTMDFLGYTHVKPVRRQWEIPTKTPGQFRYNTPGSGSSNMEDATFYLRYLLALPTLRLTLAQQSAEFLTTPLLDQLHREPLCKASLL